MTHLNKKEREQMNWKLKSSIFIIFILISCNKEIENYSIPENENQIFLPEECRKTHFQNYFDYAKYDLKIENEKLIKYYYSSKINIQKINQFEQLGINLFRVIDSFNNHDYIRTSFVANTIIEGTIVEEQPIAREQGNHFTKSHKIKVEKIFKKGQYWKGSKYVHVKTSGLTSHASYFYGQKGDKVILFLDPIFDMVKQRDRLGMNRDTIEKRLNFTPKEMLNSFSLRAEFKINKKGSKYEIRGIGDKISAYDKIKKIVEINSYKDYIIDFVNKECIPNN